jgi:hypothetical protein
LKSFITVNPRKLPKALLLYFALGAILSVASDPAITHQAETIALAKAQATATRAMQSLSKKLGLWFEQGLDATLEGIAMQFFLDG